MEPHWRDAETKLSWASTVEQRQAVAGLYLRRCHEVGLEVIGVTDHNFAPSPEQSFIGPLRQENERIAHELNRRPLTILPGFEVEANVGRGCHVLCLFAQNTPLQVLHDRLTELGLPSERRFDDGRPRQSTKTLSEIINIIQRAQDYRGIVIAAHPTDVKGLFDNDRISDWLQAQEFRNPELLCLELPKPLEQMSRGWQILIQGGEDCQPEWRRQRPIAYVMSSDCYRLAPTETEPANSIGSRYSWIKMSEPSLSSLRQAFLDRESRIRLQPHSPEEDYAFPRVASVRVQNATFLRRPETLHWSPNLNCLIGSRGVGKSTFVDYLRLALDRMRDEDAPATLLEDLRKRTSNTLSGDSIIEVELVTRAGTYKVIYHHENGVREVYPPNSDAPDPELEIRALFPCRFLSQREIDHTIAAGDSSALRGLLDDLVREDLTAVRNEATRLVGRIREIDARVDVLRESLTRRPTVETGLRLARGELELNTKLAELWPRWKALQAQEQFIRNMEQGISSSADSIRSAIVGVQERAEQLFRTLPAGEHTAILEKSTSLARLMYQQLTERIQEALVEFSSGLEDGGALWEHHSLIWKTAHTESLRDLREAGIGEDQAAFADLSAIADRVRRLETSLSEMQEQEQEILLLTGERAGLLTQLRLEWRRETQIRQNKAEQLMALLTPQPDRKPAIEIKVRHQGDSLSLLHTLTRYIPDRRRINDDDLRVIIRELPLSDERSLLESFVSELRDPNTALLDRLPDRRRGNMLETFVESVLRQLEIVRIPDEVTLLVYRHDGTLAGPIDRVSAGQQGTAVLNLLLADGDDPLIIDTPEEGLDSEGVYQELVPLFRSAKERRQIIVVTHNANIPVNADAEGIIALEASGFITDNDLQVLADSCAIAFTPEQSERTLGLVTWPTWELKLRNYLKQRIGCGDGSVEAFVAGVGARRQAESRIKRFETTDGGMPALACGALDVMEVNIAVQQVMEGSREAFERRREKYGY